MKLIDQILDLAFMTHADLPVPSRELARLSLYDWMVCGIGGLQEPVSQKILAYIQSEHAAGDVSVFGGRSAAAIPAALANGTISHALDYDDTHFAHVGHLSVGVLPAAVAAGQEVNASLDQVIDAFLVGAEAAIRVGLVLGVGHYQRGFHQTATAGSFGAAVAVIRLYGLSREQGRSALGLCATRVSGLKNQFGTMGKPMNAGFAACNAVECAKLAQLGMTSADDGLQGEQGFIATHANNPGDVGNPDGFLFDDIRYKLHACCHGTHAMIEAIHSARAEHGITVDAIETMQVFVHSKWLSVCDIKQPRSGLEIKFSYAWLAGMVMTGISCADPAAFNDALCTKKQLQTFAKKVIVLSDDAMADSSARVEFSLRGDKTVIADHDLMAEIDRQSLRTRLRDKAAVVIGEQADVLWSNVVECTEQSARGLHEFL